MKNPAFTGDRRVSNPQKQPKPMVMPSSMGRLWLFALLALAVALGAQAEEERVDVNTADAETIAQVLVGVGQSKAEAIVAYREENGRFENVEDLARVRGIGDATIKRNEARISLGEEES